MARLREERVDVGGRETVYLTAGEGEPLVFLHGGGIVEGFDCFLPLAERYRFVAPLMPGFGGTALEPAVRGIDELVEHEHRLFDALGIDSMVLAGHSLGGWNAASYTAAHPERVRRLVVAAPYGLDVEGHPLAAVFAMTPEELYRALTNDPTVFEGRVPTGPDEAFEAARALEGQAIGGFMPGPFDPALPDKLRRLDVPTLILWGDDDRIVPAGHAPAWESLVRGSRVEVFPGLGHLLFHEDRAPVEAILAFAAE